MADPVPALDDDTNVIQFAVAAHGALLFLKPIAFSPASWYWDKWHPWRRDSLPDRFYFISEANGRRGSNLFFAAETRHSKFKRLWIITGHVQSILDSNEARHI